MNVASFDYSLVPLPNGACFAGVEYLGSFNAASYDGVRLKLKGIGENEWFKVIFKQKHSYEYFFKVSVSLLIYFVQPCFMKPKFVNIFLHLNVYFRLLRSLKRENFRLTNFFPIIGANVLIQVVH